MATAENMKQVQLGPEEDRAMAEFTRWADAQPKDECSVIQLLHRAQQLFGYLPEALQREVAQRTGTPLSAVYGVATFYSFFTLFPKGRHTIRVCLGTACYVKGGKKLLEALKRELEIDVKETTPDRRFSVEVNRCMGACALAPVLVVDDDIYARVTPARIPEILAKYE